MFQCVFEAKYDLFYGLELTFSDRIGLFTNDVVYSKFSKAFINIYQL